MMLLSAISRDANNQMFPVAIALVESECKKTWTWFMKQLIEALAGLGVNPDTVTYMSDRQKVCNQYE